MKSQAGSGDLCLTRHCGGFTGMCIDRPVYRFNGMGRIKSGLIMIGKTLFSLGIFVALSAVALADAPPRPKPQAMAQGVWLIPGSFLPDRQPDGNTIVFDAPKGLIVMDTGRHTWQREAILAFAKDRKKPVAAIVNSHWHLDHVSGNPDIRAAYPELKVYASDAIEAALTGFLAKDATAAKKDLASGKLSPDEAEDVRGDLATVENGNALMPDIVIDKSMTRRIAGKLLAINFAPNAATDGDVWLFDPATKIAAAGDLVTLPTPFLDTACSKGWSTALGQIEKTPFKTLIPGHGAPMTRAQFSTYRHAFDALLVCSASSHDAKDCATEWTKSIEPLLTPDVGTTKSAEDMTLYYVKDVLRTHGGNSESCKLK